MRQLCLFIFFAGLCHGVSKATECTARGRFPNNDVTDCRGYTMCLLGAANRFTKYSLTCPTGFIYSHLEQQCTNATNYHCLPNFGCNMTGSFENPFSQNCSSFVACVDGIDGIVTARQVECPLDHVFNPQEYVCVNRTEYTCSIGEEKRNLTDSLLQMQPNTTYFNVVVTDGNGFHLTKNVSLNGAPDTFKKHYLIFAIMMFVNLN